MELWCLINHAIEFMHDLERLLDAVRLALMNNIDIIFNHTDVHPVGRIWHRKLGSTTKIRKRQLKASMSKEAVTFTKTWISEEMNNQLDNPWQQTITMLKIIVLVSDHFGFII